MSYCDLDDTMPFSAPFRCFVIAVAIGGVFELISGRLNLWTYANRATLFANVILMFGLVQGWAIAGLVGGTSPLADILPLLFMLGAVVGVIYEGLNEFVVRGWSWSETPLLGLTGSRDKAALIGVLWGLTPVAVAILARTHVMARLGGVHG
jgi:hypothetical protein